MLHRHRITKGGAVRTRILLRPWMCGFDASGHRSAIETVEGDKQLPDLPSDSALRECDESRGTRYSECHSAQIDAT